MNGEARVIIFSRKQKDIIGPGNRCYYDNQEFTSNLPAGGKINFDDAVIIFEGVPDPNKFRYK